MSVGVIHAMPGPRAPRGTIALLSLAALAAVVFVAGFAVPYFLSAADDLARICDPFLAV